LDEFLRSVVVQKPHVEATAVSRSAGSETHAPHALEEASVVKVHCRVLGEQ
jgi:hypothetical protein